MLGPILTGAILGLGAAMLAGRRGMSRNWHGIVDAGSLYMKEVDDGVWAVLSHDAESEYESPVFGVIDINDGFYRVGIGAQGEVEGIDSKEDAFDVVVDAVLAGKVEPKRTYGEGLEDVAEDRARVARSKRVTCVEGSKVGLLLRRK